MRKILYLIPIGFILLSCANTVPRKETQIPSRLDNVFNASFSQTWLATLGALKWMKWIPAFMDQKKGTIRLKEAYVYRKSENLFRGYQWPSKEEANQSGINDYLEKVAYYDNNIFDFDKAIFSQESMEIKVISLSKSQTRVEIDYKIIPYLSSGKFASQVKSNGYIESLLLEKIREGLKGRPLSYRSQIYEEISN